MPKFDTLNDIFREAIATYPDRDLFLTKKNGAWSAMTYLQFGKDVDRLRAALSGLGVGPGDKVAIIANNRPEWAALAYATYGLGAAFVPMYEAMLPKDWEFIVKDCDAKVLVAATDTIVGQTKALLDSSKTLKHLISLDSATSASDRIHTYAKLLEATGKVGMLDVKKDDLAGLIYTSGTTGNPKGVMLSHANLASNVSAIHQMFPLSAADRSLSFLPWAHSFGQVCELHGLFSLGATIAVCESVDKLLDNLAEVQPTMLFSVPRVFNKLYMAVQKTIGDKPPIIQNMVKLALKARAKQRNGEELGVMEIANLMVTDKLVFSKVRGRFGGRLRYAFSGGAALSPDVAEFIDGLGVVVYEGYGLTETSPIATANCPGARKIGSVGKAIPGVRVEISDEQEIIIHGHNVMMGYHNRPEENAAVFTPDRGFRTGDMGRVDKDGFVWITGRIKEQYKLENGKYVVPTPLEEQIKLSPFIANVMVYGDNRPFNVALIVAEVGTLKKWAGEQGVAADDIAKLLENPKVREVYKKELEKSASHFKGFEEIRDFALIAQDFTVENGMLTPSMKLKRRKVMEEYGALIDALYAKKKKPEEKASAAAAN